MVRSRLLLIILMNIDIYIYIFIYIYLFIDNYHNLFTHFFIKLLIVILEKLFSLTEDIEISYGDIRS